MTRKAPVVMMPSLSGNRSRVLEYQSMPSGSVMHEAVGTWLGLAALLCMVSLAAAQSDAMRPISDWNLDSRVLAPDEAYRVDVELWLEPGNDHTRVRFVLLATRSGLFGFSYRGGELLYSAFDPLRAVALTDAGGGDAVTASGGVILRFEPVEGDPARAAKLELTFDKQLEGQGYLHLRFADLARSLSDRNEYQHEQQHDGESTTFVWRSDIAAYRLAGRQEAGVPSELFMTIRDQPSLRMSGFKIVAEPRWPIIEHIIATLQELGGRVSPVDVTESSPWLVLPPPAPAWPERRVELAKSAAAALEHLSRSCVASAESADNSVVPANVWQRRQEAMAMKDDRSALTRWHDWLALANEPDDETRRIASIALRMSVLANKQHQPDAAIRQWMTTAVTDEAHQGAVLALLLDMANAPGQAVDTHWAMTLIRDAINSNDAEINLALAVLALETVSAGDFRLHGLDGRPSGRFDYSPRNYAWWALHFAAAREQALGWLNNKLGRE